MARDTGVAFRLLREAIRDGLESGPATTFDLETFL